MVGLVSSGKHKINQQDGKTMLVVSREEKKQRLDLYLANQFHGLSRSSLSRLVREGMVTVNGITVKGGYKIRPSDIIEITSPPHEQSSLVPEQIYFKTIFEDSDLLVLSKPPGIVVHPAAGHETGTLVHGLLYRYQNLPNQEQGRPGIVHRLDKDTSGIMLVAKSSQALSSLSSDFKDRKIHKIYHAILSSCPSEKSGRIVAPIGRHPVNRKKMAIRQVRRRYAATNWQVLETFSNGYCLAEIEIETGRTHQIRVHMASLHTPVYGDVLYGGKVSQYQAELAPRQMLHASKISFHHPVSQKKMQFEAPLWEDMEQCVEQLRELV
jgi:23S rRNA pseudouridine1911/1915/1917 synthase